MPSCKVQFLMMPGNRSRPGIYSALFALALTALFLCWGLTAEAGWGSLAFGRLSALYWGALVVWTIAVAHTLIRHRVWWVLLTVPIAPYPAFATVIVTLLAV